MRTRPSGNYCNYLLHGTPYNLVHFGKWILRRNIADWQLYDAVWADTFEDMVKYIIDNGGRIEEYQTTDKQVIYLVTL